MKGMIWGWGITIAMALSILPFFPEKIAANILLITIAVLAWVLTFIYGFRSSWTLTKAGRATLYLSLSLAAFATQLSVSTWYGKDYWGRAQIIFVLYFGLANTILYLIWVVLEAQRDEKKERPCLRW